MLGLPAANLLIGSDSPLCFAGTESKVLRLLATFPRDLVDEVIEATGRREQRNRLLPAHLVTYYVMAMSLFSSAGYEEVMRSLTAR